MAREISGGILGPVGESSDSSSEIAEPHVHGNSNTALGRATDVIAVPCDTHGDVGVDASGCDKSSQILNMWVVGGNQQDETKDAKTAEEDHEDSALSLLISEVSTTDGADTGKDVGWDAHELGLLVRVAHNLNDGWKKEGKGV